jgi:hypothetical protein
MASTLGARVAGGTASDVAADPTGPLIPAIMRAVTDSLVRKLGSMSVAELSQIDPAQLAERSAALIPAAHPFAAVGPFYTTRALRVWLGVTRQALAARVAAHTLLGCPTQRSERVFPVWQFQADGSPIPYLDAILTALSAGTEDPWVWAAWLAATVPEQLGGEPAWKLLASERDPEPVITLARRSAASWAQ